MNKIKFVKIVGIFIAVLALLAISPGIAQEKKDKDKSEKKQKEKGRKELIEEIYIVRGFSYDPGNRRDPFRRLEKSKTTQENGDREEIEGAKGFLVQEMTLKGITKTSEGPIAVLMGPDSRGYFMKPGDKLYNGKILNIKYKKRCAVFRQEVKDPLAIKPFTDVEKCLGSFGGNKK